MVLLIISNGATLLDERVHLAAYSVLADVAGIAGNTVSQSVLKRSPTYVKAREVERATKALRLQHGELSAKHNSLTFEYGKLQASRNAIAKDLDIQKAASVGRAAAVKNLSMKTASKLAARASKAISSLPLRAVPYAGIAALVAYTAVEMKEDCDLVRSLDALNTEHNNAPIDTSPICSLSDKVPSVDDTWNQVKSQANGLLKNAYGMIERAKPQAIAK